MKRLTASLLLLAFFYTGKANTFVVTSNADSGPGTLREAITLAAANGTATSDTILFNIPDTALAARTIAFDSQLPLLTSKLVVDATSQPGSAIGVSNAKVVIKPSRNYLYIGLVMVKVSQIEIYGLCFTKIPSDPDLSYTGAIYGYAVNDVIVGKPGKGNMFYDCGLGVHFSGLYSNRDSLNRRLTMQSNIFGLVNNGESAVNNFHDALFENSVNVLVGGTQESEANYFTAWIDHLYVFSFNYSNANFVDTGYFRIKGNYFGLSYVTKSGIASATAITVQGWFIQSMLSVDIENNNLFASSILFQRITPRFVVKGNRMRQMSLGYCHSGIIGGPGAEKNYIGPNNQLPGIEIYQSDSITITRNSIFCNTKGIGLIQSPKPFIGITGITAAAVSGTADPLSTVEVFGIDTCTNRCENGTVFLGSTVADAAGHWMLATVYNGPISATATWSSGQTSEFAAARLNLNNLVVKNATCGRQNGSIKGAVLESGTGLYWENQNGVTVGTSADLVNVGAGRYRLVAKMGNSSCNATSPYYDVLNIPQPQINPADIQLTHPSCGGANGAIRYTNTYNQNWRYDWFANTILIDSVNTNPLINLLPGNYLLSIKLKIDSTCYNQFGPFVLINQSGPSLNTTNLQISSATCGASTGSITGITSTNVTGTPFIRWVDSLNNPVGNGYDLTNVPPGKYRLKFKDAGGCDTIITPFYVVGNNGNITLDVSNNIIQPAKCSGNTGSIQNIAVSGATVYQWTNTTTGNVVGNTLAIADLPAGNYQLTVSNAYGCTKTSPVISVPQTTFISINVQAWGSAAAACGKPNGGIDAQTFSRDTSSYTFRWVDSLASQVVLSTSTKLRGVYGGTYILFARDSNGCEQQILKKTIVNLPVPSFDYSGIQVTPDKCLSGQGSIAALAVKDMRGGTGSYVWLNANNDSVGNSLTLQNLSPGTYHLKATDLIGCTVVSQPIVVDNVNVPLAAPQCDDQTILLNTAAALKVKNVQPGKYQWFDDQAGTALVQENATGSFTTPVLAADKIYYLRYVNGVCASNLVPVKITVVDKTAVYVPTGFTPNGDGKNDGLKIIAYGKVRLQSFTVFNRWGQVVFSSDSFNKIWNGTVNGAPAPDGVYVWMLKAVDELSGQSIFQKGTVTVIR